MISVENLCYQYKNGVPVLDHVNFAVKKGEFVAVIGQNGAGKTTLLKHFNGLLRATQGRVLVNGLDAAKTKSSLLARHIGFLFQNPDHQIFCTTVFDEIAFGLKNAGMEKDRIVQKVNAAAQQVGLLPFLHSNPFQLSKGQRQRVALASVLVMETEILVLDEPTTGQDYKEGMEIMQLVKQLNDQGKTIIMVTHDMELVARYSNRAIILCGGKVIEDGPVHQVLSKSESLALSNLQSPQIYLLARKFSKLGLFRNTFTVEEMFEEIMMYAKGERNACNG